MKKKRIIIVVAIIFFALLATFALQRHIWVFTTLAKLRRFDPNSQDSSVSFLTGEKHDDGRYFFSVNGEQTIRVGSNGWVHIITHSLHDEHAGIIVIGDQIYAIDHTGSIYQNKGHVCGEIGMLSRSATGFRSIDEFLSNSIQGHRAEAIEDWIEK